MTKFWAQNDVFRGIETARALFGERSFERPALFRFRGRLDKFLEQILFFGPDPLLHAELTRQSGPKCNFFKTAQLRLAERSFQTFALETVQSDVVLWWQCNFLHFCRFWRAGVQNVANAFSLVKNRIFDLPTRTWHEARARARGFKMTYGTLGRDEGRRRCVPAKVGNSQKMGKSGKVTKIVYFGGSKMHQSEAEKRPIAPAAPRMRAAVKSRPPRRRRYHLNSRCRKDNISVSSNGSYEADRP